MALSGNWVWCCNQILSCYAEWISVTELLVCPLTKASLIYDAAAQELISRQARLAYPIRRGVPHMLPEEARHLDDPVKKP